MAEQIGGNFKEQLRSFIERIESREEDKREIAEDIKEIYAEAKGQKFDVAAIKAIIRRRKDPEKAAEAEAVIENYLQALGWDGTPLGNAGQSGVTVQ